MATANSACKSLRTTFRIGTLRKVASLTKTLSWSNLNLLISLRMVISNFWSFSELNVRRRAFSCHGNSQYMTDLPFTRSSISDTLQKRSLLKSTMNSRSSNIRSTRASKQESAWQPWHKLQSLEDWSPLWFTKPWRRQTEMPVI